ncbi:FG-GAP repeat domain-containing protein [Melioribacteraceae bacterium 4301-Me]|uniref:FG-GAP repeat domain-containing protein n=1 Tax=Pyranulibacter aquaticus TaxID=3163344 RepID=UPI0035965BA6
MNRHLKPVKKIKKKTASSSSFKSELYTNCKKIFLIYFLFEIELYAQININGFCKWNETTTYPNFNGLLAIDFNNDGYRDLILFSNVERKLVIHKADPKSFYLKGRVIFFPYPIYKIGLLSKLNQQNKEYVFVSKASRTVGILTFLTSGLPLIKAKLHFDSYPSSFDVADINHTGSNEILVCGSNFVGLSILKEKNGRLIEQKIITKEKFKEAKFIDLDYDGYPDIAALDAINNTIHFYYNDQSGSFKEYRSIKLMYVANKFQICDVNSDSFSDILAANDNGFEYVIGDSVSSFQNTIIINTEDKPTEFNVLDYNDDGLDDVSFISLDTGNLFVLFNKDNNKFYQPINYFQRVGLSTIISFVDRRGKHLIALSSTGNIFEITSLRFVKDSFSLSFTPYPRLLRITTNNKQNERNYFIVDTVRLKMIVLSVQKNGIVATYNEYPISDDYTNIDVSYLEGGKKDLLLFKTGERKIELLSIDSEDHKFSRKVFYTPYPIYDAKFHTSNEYENQTIYALLNSGSKLLLQKFVYKDFRFVSEGIITIGSYSEDALIDINSSVEIYWIAKINNEIHFYRTTNQLKNYKEEELYHVPYKDVTHTILITLENRVKNSIPILLYWLNEKLFAFYQIKTQPVKIDNSKIACPKNFFNVLYDARSKTYTLFYYDKDESKLIKYEFAKGDKTAKRGKLIELQDISNYFATSIKRDSYLIISTTKSNAVEFKNLE